jgi:hypothetical protein
MFFTARALFPNSKSCEENCCSADGNKDPSLGLTYFAIEFFHEVGNVDLTEMMAAENPKNENVQSF